MRVSIVLAICFLGVASASTLVKRSFFDDIQNKSQEALKNLEHFRQDFQQKFKDLFEHHEENVTEVVVSKRFTNPFDLINDIGNPVAFTQDFIKILAEVASRGKRDIAGDLKNFGQNFQQKIKDGLSKIVENSQADPLTQEFVKIVLGLNDRQKRDLAENLKNFGQDFQQKLQQALKNLFGNHGASEETSTEVVVSKRFTNPFDLINDIGNPVAFAQDFIKILAEVASRGRKKRDVAEDLKKIAEAGKQRAQEALKKLMDLFNSFRNGGSAETSTEKTVSKRDINEDLKKIADAGKEKVQEALKQLQGLFEQFKGGFNHDQSSETVTKRDIAESLKQLGQAAQEKTQAAFSHIRQALENLFKGFKPAQQSAEEETSTEVSVSKRSIADFQEKVQEALSGFKNAFQNFFNQFRKPVQEEAEDTTESS